MNRNTAWSSVLFVALSSAACANLDTGGSLVRFHAYAAGLPGTNGTAEFDTGEGFHVALTSARLHVGAVYLRLGKTNPGSATASCYGDTTYGLEVPGPVDVDVLTDRLQEFSVLGDATSDLDQSAEIWLTGGDINQIDDDTQIATVAGTATRGGATYPFEGSLTIGRNWLKAPTNPAEPGASPICKQRIVSPVPVAVHPEPGGDLLFTIDPRPFWLNAVDFSTLPPSEQDASVREISDDGVEPGSLAFFSGVTSVGYQAGGPSSYRFSWFTP